MRFRWILCLVAIAACAATLTAQQAAPLQRVKTIAMENVQGRIDHFSVDLKGQRLFMAALGNNAAEVFDLGADKRIHTITGLHEPQGVWFVPGLNKLFVANGEGGAVDVFDGASYKPLGHVNLSDDADNVRYDPVRKEIYVGYGDGGLGIIGVASGKLLGDIRLPKHPESFQLETSGPRIFVNIPNAQEIVVIDRVKLAVIARWPLGGYHGNYPMALDEIHHRLFVGCRRPAEIMVMDTASGKVVTKIPCVGDTDDVWYDFARKRIYVSGGEGSISVIEQVDADHYRSIARIPTAPGARTSYFIPALRRLYLAVPHRGNQKAELRIYEVTP